MPTKKELQDICRKRGIPRFSKLNKAQLEHLISIHKPLPPVPSSRNKPFPPLPPSSRNKLLPPNPIAQRNIRETDIRHKKIVKNIRKSISRDKRLSPPGYFHVDKIGEMGLFGISRVLDFDLQEKDIPVIRWNLASWIESEKLDFTKKPWYEIETEFEGFLYINRKRIMKQVLEERRLQKQKKIERYKGEKKAIDTVLDPYVIDDLRNIIKTYLKPQI